MATKSSSLQEQSASTSAKLDGPETMEQKIIALANTKPKGISDKDLADAMPDLQPVQRAQVINKLLSQGYLEVFKQAGSLFYRIKDTPKLIKGADNEEKIVYKIIEESKNKGIWNRDIRVKSNLMHAPLKKILKSLENKKLVKVVKNVANKKKVYMLYSTEPDESLTGGAWYQDQDFETEFVDVLNQQCYRFLKEKKEKVKSCNNGPIAVRNMTYASSQEVLKFISELGISTVKLFLNDIEMILNTLVYDGKVEKILAGEGNNLYRAIQPVLSSSGLVKTPCGLCPIRTQCRDDGPVTPIKCHYIKDWLEYF